MSKILDAGEFDKDMRSLDPVDFSDGYYYGVQSVRDGEVKSTSYHADRAEAELMRDMLSLVIGRENVNFIRRAVTLGDIEIVKE